MNLNQLISCEILVLEDNRLSVDQDFMVLASMPRLRELNVSKNYYKSIPKSVLDIRDEETTAHSHAVRV